MPLEAVATIFKEPSQAGISRMLALGGADRLDVLHGDDLQSLGLASNVRSAALATSALSDANLMFFENKDLSGSFLQLNVHKDQGEEAWTFNVTVGSVIVLAAMRAGETEIRLSGHGLIDPFWTIFLDAQLAGSGASRVGLPTVTWHMFPALTDGLYPSEVYIKIYQPLHISVPHWFDYAASITYYLRVFNDPSLGPQAQAARAEGWVESGILSGDILDKLKPNLWPGIVQMEGLLNTEFGARQGSRDFYFLPGNQTAAAADNALSGDTDDDVTIVLIT